MSAESPFQKTAREQMGREEFRTMLLERARCPRCEDEDLRVKEEIRDDGYNLVGLKVMHESDPCSRRAWPIYDPEAGDEYLGNGLSVCRTCLSHVQHLKTVGEPGDNKVEVTEPPRDDDGEIICNKCGTPF